jgi:hypothetical protein
MNIFAKRPDVFSLTAKEMDALFQAMILPRLEQKRNSVSTNDII